MQILFDLLPVIAFYAAYKLTGDNIYVATGVLMVGMVILATTSWIRHRKVSPLLLSSTALVLVFGSLTLLIHDSVFIRWKPTILNWLFATLFVLSHLKPPILVQRLMGEAIQLDQRSWNQLSLMWIVFFIIAGTLNLYVAFNFPESTWVTFKSFGLMGLSVVFVVLQGIWLSRRAEQQPADQQPADPQ
jgi:intracellular septation protein